MTRSQLKGGVPIDVEWKGPDQCRTCRVRDHDIFSLLSDEDFALISQPIDQPQFAKGETLFHAGDPAEHFYTIREGVIKLLHEDADGNEQIVGLLAVGDVLGIEALVSSKYQYTAVAIEDLLTCKISLSTIIDLDRKLPHFRKQLMSRWQHSVDKSNRWLIEFRTGPVKSRFAHLTLCLAEKDPNRIIPMLTVKDLGLILGSKTETVSRIAAEFKRSGLLQKVAARRYRVDVEGVTELIGKE